MQPVGWLVLDSAVVGEPHRSSRHPEHLVPPVPPELLVPAAVVERLGTGTW